MQKDLNSDYCSNVLCIRLIKSVFLRPNKTDTGTLRAVEVGFIMPEIKEINALQLATQLP